MKIIENSSHSLESQKGPIFFNFIPTHPGKKQQSPPPPLGPTHTSTASLIIGSKLITSGLSLSLRGLSPIPSLNQVGEQLRRNSGVTPELVPSCSSGRAPGRRLQYKNARMCVCWRSENVPILKGICIFHTHIMV